MRLDIDKESTRCLIFGFIYGQAELNIEPKEAIDNFCARHNVEFSRLSKEFLLIAYDQFNKQDLFLDRYSQ